MPGIPERIVITRLSAIGDCIHTLPLACAVRDLYPRAYLAWVVERAAAPLVGTLAEIDRVIVVQKDLLRSPQGLWQVRRELRAEQFDLALDPQSLMKSAALGWVAGASRRIGFAQPVGREIAPWLNNCRVRSRAAHMVDRYLELLRPLGVEQPAVRFGLRIPPDAAAAAAGIMKQSGLTESFAVLNPGAGWPSRIWPVERYGELARQLGDAGLPSLVVWGGNRERAWAEQIVAAAGGAARLAPPTSLLELAAVFARAQVFVGSDTGPLHLAAAVGTPCVGLHGSSRPEHSGAYGPGHRSLQAAIDDSPDRKRPTADNWAMRAITSEMAAAACRQILDRTSAPPRAAGSRAPIDRAA